MKPIIWTPSRSSAFAATGAIFGVLLVAGAAVSTASCAQTPPNSPVRSFDRAQKVDVVCMHVEDYDPNSNIVTEVYPQPLPQAQCTPAPIYVDGTTLPNHLFAMVTQTTRGEVAIVDLTAGNVVDIDNSTPGINFLPVGKNPTDIGSTPDGTMTFVAAAEPGKPAIYALDSRVILGDSRAFNFDLSTVPDAGAPPPFKIPTLTTWPACALPQAPGAMSIVPAAIGSNADAGAADAGSDANPSYTIAVVLPGDEVNSAKLLTLDPKQFTDGTIGPGSLTSCRILSTTELLSPAVTTWTPGPTWDDGIREDGGFNESVVTLDPGNPDAGIAPTTTLVFPAGVGNPPLAASCATFDAGSGANTISDVPVLTPRGGFMARDATTLYIADESIAMIHVIDVSNPAAPHENPPLLATSQLEPSRKVVVGQIAVSPSTRDFRRYLYAIDQTDGSIMIFDVSNPSTTARTPLTRPHPELNPFSPPDRISFSYPVASLAFASHDYSPLASGAALQRGILCNPNKAAGLSFPPADPGAYYRANNDPTNASFGIEGSVGLGPNRLRGVFGFATLTNGSVVVIDVDDWDSPCRRPDPMGDDPQDDEFPNIASPLISSVTPNEPGHNGAQDLNPYHAPVAYGDRFNYPPAAGAGITTGTSNEAFFPVSAPNRLRSQVLLSNSASTGQNIPKLSSQPLLAAVLGTNSTPLAISGVPGTANPMMLPTYSDLSDISYEAAPTTPDPTQRQPSFPNGATAANGKGGLLLSEPVVDALPGVRISWEDPTAHIQQNWQVTYEGVLPAFSGTPSQSGFSANLSTTDGFHSLSMNTGANMCRRGVEDAQVGAERANEYLAALPKYGIQAPNRLDHRLGDYVQLSEDVIFPSDPYWSEDDSNEDGGTCWDFDTTRGRITDPGERQSTCQSLYGYAGSPESIQRDFPIWQASDDHFVITRYGYTDASNDPATREIVGPDASNVAAMKAMMCCFHRSIQFQVRTGGEWLATGSVIGLLHHMTKDSNNACVQSCEPREALLNSRSIGLPRANLNTGLTPPDRNSVLALRNPMFAFLMWNGADPTGKIDYVPARDMQWQFSMSGQFQPLVINYAGTTTAAVSPQSMLFLQSFGRVAVVDGSSAGLILLDLNNVVVNGGPYY